MTAAATEPRRCGMLSNPNLVTAVTCVSQLMGPDMPALWGIPGGRVNYGEVPTLAGRVAGNGKRLTPDKVQLKLIRV